MFKHFPYLVPAVQLAHQLLRFYFYIRKLRSG